MRWQRKVKALQSVTRTASGLANASNCAAQLLLYGRRRHGRPLHFFVSGKPNTGKPIDLTGESDELFADFKRAAQLPGPERDALLSDISDVRLKGRFPGEELARGLAAFRRELVEIDGKRSERGRIIEAAAST
jgi:hypothetical protein